MDEDCSKQDEGEDDVAVFPTQEHIGTPFILVFQATYDIKKYTAFMVIQQVYRGPHEEHPRRKAYRKGMKFDPYLPIKVKCPKLFEVEDQINPIFQIYDEGAKRRRNSFDGPAASQFFKI